MLTTSTGTLHQAKLCARTARVADRSRVPFSTYTVSNRSRNSTGDACSHRRKQGSASCRGLGKDTVEGWIDLSKLVSGSGGVKTAFEDLAYKIGHDVYIDVSGWHLFLREVKAAKGLNLAQALAQQFGQDISSGSFSKRNMDEVLKKIPVKLGGGKTQLPLIELLPSASVQDLEQILTDFEKDK